MKIAILTCSKFPDLAPRDEHLPALFAQKKVHTDNVTWNAPDIDWRAWDGLLFRSVWDYHLLNNEFNQWLNHIEQLQVKALNPIKLIKENQHKFYLKELRAKGVEIVPTIFIDKTEKFSLSVIENHPWQQAVIKPAVSCGSYLTTLFNCRDWQLVETEYQAIAATSDLLLQPYMPEVIEIGELSLIFFNRKYSHAVIKRATDGEFRVQAFFGGQHESITPEKSIIETAENIISLIEGPLLYARVDGLIKNGKFILMELEMLEPDLFFDADIESSNRYVDAAIELFKQ